MYTLCSLIDRLIDLSITNGLITACDTIYCRNRLLSYFKEAEYEISPAITTDLYETLDALCEIAVQKELVEDTLPLKDVFSSNLMNVFLDKPSVIQRTFWEKYSISPQTATDYFYHQSRACNYVKVNRIAKNQAFLAQSPYGDLEITINLSKPEKDPKQIALEKNAPPNKYPLCLLCLENEGYEGTIKLPDRANHRLIQLKLGEKNWALQYSPYLYYNEHCIVLSHEHQPMQIQRETFENLIAFTTQFPHYFLGSNADLPIVGGSILSHEHYQGGCHTFPINKAKDLFQFEIADYPQIQASVLNWPMTTIKLVSEDTNALVELSDYILKTWRQYSDPDCDIFSHTNETPHNTITPIANRDGKNTILYLVLRNNRTTPEHPLGLFHPHQEVHHIKKENIGLIEVMGLAILPGRLLDEIEAIKAYIIGQEASVAAYHLPWAQELKANYQSNLPLDDYIKQGLGKKFTQVLENAGVYKLTPEGLEGIKRFLATL
jgi:UDPglucose--hexose-1-phosphate uridylyltransferase